METTRRELGFWMPALLAAFGAEAQKGLLPSRTYEFGAMPVKANAATKGESRQVLSGATHEGVLIDVHITELPAGQVPHPPHEHEWEEMMFVQTGTMEYTIGGNVSRVGAGSVVYVASNERHGAKNAGDVAAQYFVLTIGRRV